MGEGPNREQCQGCSSLTYDQEWHRAFGVRLCLMCKEHDDLISKVAAERLSLESSLLGKKDLRAPFDCAVQLLFNFCDGSFLLHNRINIDCITVAITLLTCRAMQKSFSS